MTDFAFQVVADAGQANRALDEVTRRLDGITRQAATSGRLISQKLADVGKGLGFQFAAQGFDKLKDSLGAVSSAALSAGASGASMGATFAGPWGAAIGGAIGLTKGLVTGMLDEEKAANAARKAVEAQGKAYWDSVHAAQRKQAVEASLADTMRMVAKAEREAAEAAQTRAGARDSRGRDVARLQDIISGYQDELSRLEGRGGLEFETPVGSGSEEEKIAVRRKLRDAQLELDAATKSYGQTLLPILKAENERKDRIADIEQILGRENLSQEEQKRLLAEVNTLYRAGGRTLEEYNKELAEMAKYHAEIAALRALEGRNMTDTRSLPGFAAPFPTPVNYTAGLNSDPHEVGGTHQSITEQADRNIEARADEIMRANGKLIEVSEEQKKAAADVKEAWSQGLGSIAADFVNMAAAGEMSLERLGTSLAKLALQIAAMQIGGPWGAFLGSFAGGLSLPGHATGTQFMVGGRGGSDQNIVAFRASGNERVTVETPEDVRSGRYMGGGKQVTQVVVQSDPREVVSALGTRAAEREVVRLNRKFRRS